MRRLARGVMSAVEPRLLSADDVAVLNFACTEADLAQRHKETENLQHRLQIERSQLQRELAQLREQQSLSQLSSSRAAAVVSSSRAPPTTSSSSLAPSSTHVTSINARPATTVGVAVADADHSSCTSRFCGHSTCAASLDVPPSMHTRTLQELLNFQGRDSSNDNGGATVAKKTSAAGGGALIKKKANVLIATFEYAGGPRRVGGIGTAYSQLALALATAGHNVTVLLCAVERVDDFEWIPWQRRLAAKGIVLDAAPLPELSLTDAGCGWSCIKSYCIFEWMRRQLPLYVCAVARSMSFVCLQKIVCFAICSQWCLVQSIRYRSFSGESRSRLLCAASEAAATLL
jgi:hypothetical protein